MSKYFVASLLVLLLVFGLAACSVFSPPRSITVGMVNSIESADPAIEGFMAGMENLGFTSGENITYIYAGVMGEPDEMAAQVEEFIAADVDMIFSVTTDASTAVMEANQAAQIPVVFAAVRDPVEAGFVESLIQPGGNMTGVLASGDAIESGRRRLDWLVTMVPIAQKIWVPYEDSDTLAPTVEALGITAADLGVELVLSAVSTPEQVLALLENIPEDVDGIYYVGGRAFVGLTDLYIEKALAAGLPISVNYCNGARNGALTAFCSDFYSSGVQAARIASQILDDIAPSSIPVEQPELLMLINLNTANQIGLDISDEIIQMADEIIRE
ncbi:MAG: ABC transporter substrate-binding protein [Chloroflexi bacterium]|nr:ABC transporter substrate-binding protein [Chloroflexota bacterium]